MSNNHNLSPQDYPTTHAGLPLNLLKSTNVSNPSIIEHKPSLQSVTASEDYYSLSNSSGASSIHSGASTQRAFPVAGRTESENTIHRYTTPPSRYRTPAQSRDFLPHSTPRTVEDLTTTTATGALESRRENGGVSGGAVEVEQPGRKTPMRGQGKRRMSTGAGDGYPGTVYAGEASTAAAAVVATGGLREGGVRRQPIPSTVMEGDGVRGSPASEGYIDPALARSSVAMDMEREESPPTPGVDDTPFIRFALDQLTRDEEVRGSRAYRGPAALGPDTDLPYTIGVAHRNAAPPFPAMQEQRSAAIPRAQAERGEEPISREGGGLAIPYPAIPPVVPAAAPNEAPPQRPNRQGEAAAPQQRPGEYLDEGVARRGAPPQQPQYGAFDSRFLPVSSYGTGIHAPLTFLPGVLRPSRLLLYLFAVLAYIVCLMFSAIWSLRHTGLWDYGRIGDGKYFVFEYLPTILGMILFFWTLQVELAIYRIAPLVALSSPSPRERSRGAFLPTVPKGFVLPYLGHFAARQMAVGIFMIAAWLQIWTIPLLASSFNVYFYGAPNTGRWRWIATQGAIWPVIAIYLFLAGATIALLVWLRFGRRVTGLKWDPRSLADQIVLLSRSNALDQGEENGAREPPQLGYWRTNARPNEVFHTYGYPDKEGRRYSLEDGRIREKAQISAFQPPRSRFSAIETNDELEADAQRHSREKMLPRAGADDEETGMSENGRHSALPWFLHPATAALWPIIAIVLLLAFLIVSYLPSTRVRNGFPPLIPAPVDTSGFSSTNFLYSFLPALLGMLCFLFWLDIDYAHRRLQLYEALMQDGGELAERSLLLAYTADLPGFVTASALANRHWRVAALSFVTLIAATLPILGGGVFWAQFYVSEQTVKISAQMPGYYALTFFVTIFVLAYLAIFPSRRLRRGAAYVGQATGSARLAPASSFAEVQALVSKSRILDDVAFHSPASKTDLVTRLLSAPNTGVGAAGFHEKGRRVMGQQEEAGASRVSLADSVRGFGRARQKALGGAGALEEGRYTIGTQVGRDGREFVGVDRVRK